MIAAGSLCLLIYFSPFTFFRIIAQRNYFMQYLHTYRGADQRHIKYYFLMATLAMDSLTA